MVKVERAQRPLRCIFALSEIAAIRCGDFAHGLEKRMQKGAVAVPLISAGLPLQRPRGRGLFRFGATSAFCFTAY